MKQKRHTTEEIIRILREGDSGKSIETVCRAYNIATTRIYDHRRSRPEHSPTYRMNY